jgi:glycerol-3-phosphate acyltransferase PlsY
MSEGKFISEEITVDRDRESGRPVGFAWNETVYKIKEIIASWPDYGFSAGAPRKKTWTMRRHRNCYRVETTDRSVFVSATQMMFAAGLIASYLIGGIPFGLIVGHIAGVGDIRAKGSGNVGATNVWRLAGFKAALFVFAGDIAKGVVAVLLSRSLFDPSWPVGADLTALLFGLAAILGHVFSPYLKFRGGKGVNTGLGVFVTLMPLEVGISFVVFVLVVAVSRYVSLGSLCGTATLVIVLFVRRFGFGQQISDVYLGASIIILALLLFTHRSNIKRLLNGTENQLNLRKADS